ncbi:hypothetical protein JQ582_27505 [Bradyrhizobium japonicum]|uniref:DUF2382 domain-containing protein n=1 Tax=Bradyrhizobium japonicum TaxID=375 RepID=A0ABV2RXE4_BRAJP|nr:hypothetical protein [Bradyrhizobium japonicum]AHY50460.1 hypothetical protein BJS_03306 [Bradyrhizobium japonicum SEMIA 5079]MBR0747689.1 hypothetical protein [Bradyrhizobium japonicum]MBR0910270.1 hypothetical protein [Bradyrhizobium japonicum]MCD9113045.1 hypothetical protein [Bradyrhizobium japonicum]MCD9260398.1 hypothetical protein [Bradyrhizobium japonicum SEMIA 5079]
MSEIDPTDHALATIASILEHPEPALVVRETETEMVVAGEQVVADEHPVTDEHPVADEHAVVDEHEHPVVEEQPLVPEHTDADGYSKVGPGPMVAIRLKWTVHRGDDDQYYVHETIGEQSAPVVSGPMTSEAAVHFVDAHEDEAHRRFEELRSEIAGRSSLADYERKGEA